MELHPTDESPGESSRCGIRSSSAFTDLHETDHLHLIEPNGPFARLKCRTRKAVRSIDACILNDQCLMIIVSQRNKIMQTTMCMMTGGGLPPVVSSRVSGVDDPCKTTPERLGVGCIDC